jgi:hypothetical protein
MRLLPSSSEGCVVPSRPCAGAPVPRIPAVAAVKVLIGYGNGADAHLLLLQGLMEADTLLVHPGDASRFRVSD